jgi:hypothetical protein
LFSRGTISLPEIIESVKTINVEFMDTSGNTTTSRLNSRVQNTKKENNWQQI